MIPDAGKVLSRRAVGFLYRRAFIMAEPLVLTFDIGTQSMRGLIVTATGDFVDFCQVKYDEPYFSVHNGWAEQKPDFYFDIMCNVANTLAGRNPEAFRQLCAVTVTVIRDTTLCLDGDNKPLRDIILWLDKREAEYTDEFGFLKTAVFKLVDMYDSAIIQFKASVGNWLMQNEPDVWAKTEKYVMLPAYLNWKLTGNLVDSVANIIGHVPFDYKNRRWMSKNGLTRKICDIPPEKLPKLVNSGEVVGGITHEASVLTGIPEGLPLIATGSDKGCETVGLSVLEPGKAAISFGTTATVQFTVKKYFEPQRFMPAYPAVPNDRFNPEIQIYRGYWMLSWFIKEFGQLECEQAKQLGCVPEEIFNSRLADVPPGCNGLVLQPYWTPGITIPNAHGTIVGFTDVHTKQHLYRAIIEGVGFALMDALYTMERRSKTRVTELYVGGGGAQSDEICRITADMFGLPVKRIQTHEACALGSSMAAFIHEGVYASYDDAVKGMIREGTVFEPDMCVHEIYKRLYAEVYTGIYPRLLPLYKKLNNMKRSGKL